jgi:polyketide biosynthesis enoyl-CoA hydratase PksI
MSRFPLEIVASGVATLRVASDEAPYFGDDIVDALSAAVREVEAGTTIHAVILVGGSRHFSAGAARESLLRPDARETILSYAARLPEIILSFPIPCVAAMEGHAIGGGLSLGLWCDMAFLAEESLYGANFMALGFTPGLGSTLVLEEAFGAFQAREMLLAGRLWKGRELKTGPLSHAILPRAAVWPRSLALAEELAEVPREALGLLKAALSTPRRERLAAANAREQQMHARLFAGRATQGEIAERYTEKEKKTHDRH